TGRRRRAARRRSEKRKRPSGRKRSSQKRRSGCAQASVVRVALVDSCGDRQKSIVDTRCTQPTVQYGAHDFGVENSRRISAIVYDSSRSEERRVGKEWRS